MAVNNDDLLKSAKKNISLIETELGKKLNNYINNENSAIGKLKEQIVVGNIINIKTGKVVENIIIPPEIIDAFAGPVAEKIDDSTISKYSKSKWAKQILSQIAAAVRTIAPIKKNGYTIIYESLPTTIAKIGSISAKVTWSKNGNDYESELKWENFSQKTLEEYFNTLTQLNNVLWKEFAKQLVLDSAKVVKALYGLDKNQSLLKQIFGNKILKSATKEKIISEVKKYIEKVSSNSNEILNIIKKYQTAVKKYTDFEDAVSKNNDIHKPGQAFIDACNDVEKSLGMSLSTLPGGDAPEGLTYNFDRTAVTVSAAYGTIIDPVGYDKTVQVIDASSRSKAITIIGNEKNNTIYGGYGNDSIVGSTGSDKLF